MVAAVVQVGIQALVQAAMVVVATVVTVVPLRQLLELPIGVAVVVVLAALVHPHLQHNQAVLVDLA
jgi:hypothetical protein